MFQETNNTNVDNNIADYIQRMSKTPGNTSLDVPTSVTVSRDLRNTIHALAIIQSKTIKEYVSDLVANNVKHLNSTEYTNYHIVKHYLDVKDTKF